MNFIKRFFSKKTKIKEVEEEIDNSVIGSCTHCGILMHTYDKTSKMGNNRYHIKCLRGIRKQVKKDYKSGRFGNL